VFEALMAFVYVSLKDEKRLAALVHEGRHRPPTKLHDNRSKKKRKRK
jgi:hypothetical protein